MALSLLDFPTELLVHIFRNLNISDLVACQLTHSYFRAIINDSIVLSYLKATVLAAVEDNPHSKLSVSERLALLKNQEDAWQDFRIDFKQAIKVNHNSTGIYDLSSGVYLLGDHNRHTLHYVRLPTQPSDLTTWSKINVEGHIIDMAFAIDEHDLIAVVTTIPQDDSETHIIGIELLKFSTGQLHPQARHSKISVANSEWDWLRPSISMEICGDNLALVITGVHEDQEDGNEVDRFYIYDWKTGVLKMDIVREACSLGGVVFLSPQVLLLPNTSAGVLELWKVPSTPDTAVDGPHVVLGLPTLTQGHFITALSCRGEPNPVADTMPHSNKAFYPSPNDAIVILNLRIQANVGLDSTFSIFVHRRALLKHCTDSMLALSPHQPQQVRWESWGPSVTRWLGVGVMPTRWITTTCGQRCVFRLSRIGDGPSPIVILDFNPPSVRCATSDVRPWRQVETQPSEIVHASFEAPVISSLPYACYLSREAFDYAGLLMDEERLIGLHTDASDRVSQLEVLHFG